MTIYYRKPLYCNTVDLIVNVFHYLLISDLTLPSLLPSNGQTI